MLRTDHAEASFNVLDCTNTQSSVQFSHIPRHMANDRRNLDVPLAQCVELEKMLTSQTFLAKSRFDSVENATSKVCQ